MITFLFYFFKKVSIRIRLKTNFNTQCVSRLIAQLKKSNRNNAIKKVSVNKLNKTVFQVNALGFIRHYIFLETSDQHM